MIAKKIARDGAGRTAATQIAALLNYIVAGDRDDPADKLIAGGLLNMYADSPKAAIAEMTALSMSCPKSKMPVSHWVLSWKEGERPSAEQVKEAVSIFVRDLGFEGHQCVWGAHGNTDNLHAHVAINRIHPDTEKVVKPHQGFDRLAAQRAITRIEHVQGWEPETRAKYVIDDAGNVRPKSEPTTPVFRPGYRAAAVEIRQGVKSTQRLAHEKLADVVKNAKSWSDLHAMFAYAGAVYEPSGGGAVIKLNGVTIKASDLQASPKKLAKRLGPFQPCDTVIAKTVESSPPAPSTPIDADAAIYQKERCAWNAARKKAREGINAETRKSDLQAEQRAERAAALKGAWKGKGAERNALESFLAEKHRTERVALDDAIKREKADLHERFPDFPDINEWKKRRAEQERSYITTTEQEQEHMQRIAERLKREIAEIPKEEPLERRQETERASLERFITDARPPDGGASARGKMRARHERQSYEATPEGGLDTWHKALGADGYRVSTRVEGKPINQFLGRYDRGKGEKPPHFTPGEIDRDWMSLMKSRATRREHIYYTPISHTRHFILVDDLNAQKLAKLRSEGYRPALVQESSPGNFQAFLAAPRIAARGTAEAEIEHRAANAIFRSINKEFGDEKISAVVHPARAPGFPNSKEKHRRSDGSFPRVKILEAAGGFCEKLIADLATAIEGLRKAASPHKAAPPSPRQASPAPPAAFDDDRLRALFEYHWKDAERLASGPLDASRTDYRTCIRLRVIGYDRGEIADVLRIAGPGMRGDGGASKGGFSEYADKTAMAAFGPAGDADAAKYAHWRTQWLHALDDYDSPDDKNDSPSPE